MMIDAKRDETVAVAPKAADSHSAGSLRSRLAKVAKHVVELRPGDKAELRRLSPRRTPPEPFWNIVARYEVRPDEEDFFLRVIPVMVRCAHNPGKDPGRQLRQASVTPARVERWLRMRRDAALLETRRILAQVREGVDWGVLGKMLYLWDHPSHGDGLRRELARSYYLTADPTASEPNTATATGEDE